MADKKLTGRLVIIFLTLTIILVSGSRSFLNAQSISNTQNISKIPNISNSISFVTYAEDIYDNPLTPPFANPDGNLTIVEFCDYLSNNCKDVEKSLEKLFQEDNSIKLIYKDIPQGPLSVIAAIASLASTRQGPDKYLVFHQALLDKNVSLTSEDIVYQIASSAGLDTNTLKQDMADSKLSQQVQDNITLAKNLGVQKTPTFIVDGYVFSGDFEYSRLKQMVGFVRSKEKS